MRIHTDPDNPQFFGDKVTLTVIATGLNAVSYQWLKNNSLISTAKNPACDGLSTPKLTISPFTRDYEGNYKCQVSCIGGEIIKSTTAELALGK